MIPTLPLDRRNRLAALVVAALSAPDARAKLAALGAGTSPPPDWRAELDARHESLLVGRARAAARALEREPLRAPTTLADALRAAAVLFDAGLGFEAHEVLESHWRAAEGATRDVLQGLIQVTVGYQHLANGNSAGAGALLREGSERLRAGGLPGLDLVPFRAAVLASLACAADTVTPPRFPRTTRAA